MTPRQIIAEIVNEYRYSIQLGMTERQARQVMVEMFLDYFESEKEKHFELGVKSGRIAAHHERDFLKRS